MALKTVIKRLAAAQSVLFVCDVQELFRPLIYRSATVIDRTVLLTKTSRTLDIPVVVTRQYPKVFGETCREIQEELDKFEDKDLVTDVAKTQFSMPRGGPHGHAASHCAYAASLSCPTVVQTVCRNSAYGDVGGRAPHAW